MSLAQIKTEKNLDEFIAKVDKLVQSSNVDYIDAIIHLCEKEGLEIEVVAKIIKSNARIKARVQEDAENLNFLPKRSTLIFE